MYLIVDSDENTILSYRRLLYANGILSAGIDYRNALKPEHPENIEAMILTNPYDDQKPPYFCRSFHYHYPGIPVIMLTFALKDSSEDIKAADILLDMDSKPTKLFNDLMLALSAYYKRDVAEFLCGCVRDHLLMPSPTWCGIPFHLTYIERAVLRYLMTAYPRIVTAKELLRFCVKPGSTPSLCNISTHICSINRKTLQKFHCRIIDTEAGYGYRFILQS